MFARPFGSLAAGCLRGCSTLLMMMLVVLLVCICHTLYFFSLPLRFALPPLPPSPTHGHGIVTLARVHRWASIVIRSGHHAPRPSRGYAACESASANLDAAASRVGSGGGPGPMAAAVAARRWRLGGGSVVAEWWLDGGGPAGNRTRGGWHQPSGPIDATWIMLHQSLSGSTNH